MSRVRIKNSLFSLVDKSTKQLWRKVADDSTLHVYYATGPSLLASNKPLRDLAASGDAGAAMADEYSRTLIKFMKLQNFPDFNRKNVKANAGGEAIFDWTDPNDPNGVALAATQGATGTGFARIKAVAEHAHRAAQGYMKQKHKQAWTDFEVDPGHLTRTDQPGATPALLRSQEARSIVQPREFGKIHLTGGGGRSSKAKFLGAIDAAENAVITAHMDNSTKYTRDFDATGILSGNITTAIIIQHDQETNQKAINKFETSLGTKISALMRGLKVSTLQGSPSIVDILTKALSNSFKGIKNVRKRYTTAVAERKKYKEKRTVKKIDASKRIGLKTPKVVTRDDEVNLLNIQNLINQVLSLRVKQLMGKATDPAVKLRYQNGRFSDSAVLLTLTKTQAGILAGSYTYQKSPYEVFAPGHPLDNGSRDPAIYIEGAIRNAAMSLLKTKFPGIVLESK